MWHIFFLLALFCLIRRLGKNVQSLLQISCTFNAEKNKNRKKRLLAHSVLQRPKHDSLRVGINRLIPFVEDQVTAKSSALVQIRLLGKRNCVGLPRLHSAYFY
jgi:hypothetical protein